ncbi:MAG: hypothetical protein WCU74_05925 [Candidatus Omnitrophota bacterium]
MCAHLILSDSLAYASQSAAQVSAKSSVLANPSPDVTIPTQFGVIEEVYGGSQASKTGKTVIYIQDAHDSLEAQQNIARMIADLVGRKGIRTVYEEGYEGEVPTESYFGFIGDRAVRERVSAFLMDKLRIGGAEYAHINRRKDFKLVGADSIKLHLKNVAWYRRSAARKQETAEDLQALASAIGKIASRNFPKELKQWMRWRKKLDSGAIDLGAYVDRLTELYGKAVISMPRSYPYLALWLSVRKGIDTKTAEQIKTIDPKMLFEEISRMENALAETVLSHQELSPKGTAPQLFRYYKTVELLTRLNEIRLSAPEFQAVRKELEQFNTRELAGFLVAETQKPVVLSRQWEANIRHAVRFYHLALMRDSAISKRLDEFMKNPAEQTAVLVFGGFHKDRIREILAQKGLSYVVVTPRITREDRVHQAYYKRLMSAGYHPFEIPLNLARAAKTVPVFSIPGGRREIRAVYDAVNVLNVRGRETTAFDIETALQHSFSAKESAVLPLPARAEIRAEKAVSAGEAPSWRDWVKYKVLLPASAIAFAVGTGFLTTAVTAGISSPTLALSAAFAANVPAHFVITIVSNYLGQRSVDPRQASWAKAWRFSALFFGAFIAWFFLKIFLKDFFSPWNVWATIGLDIIFGILTAFPMTYLVYRMEGKRHSNALKITENLVWPNFGITTPIWAALNYFIYRPDTGETNLIPMIGSNLVPIVSSVVGFVLGVYFGKFLTMEALKGRWFFVFGVLGLLAPVLGVAAVSILSLAELGFGFSAVPSYLASSVLVMSYFARNWYRQLPGKRDALGDSEKIGNGNFEISALKTVTAFLRDEKTDLHSYLSLDDYWNYARRDDSDLSREQAQVQLARLIQIGVLTSLEEGHYWLDNSMARGLEEDTDRSKNVIETAVIEAIDDLAVSYENNGFLENALNERTTALRIVNQLPEGATPYDSGNLSERIAELRNFMAPVSSLDEIGKYVNYYFGLDDEFEDEFTVEHHVRRGDLDVVLIRIGPREGESLTPSYLLLTFRHGADYRLAARAYHFTYQDGILEDPRTATFIKNDAIMQKTIEMLVEEKILKEWHSEISLSDDAIRMYERMREKSESDPAYPLQVDKYPVNQYFRYKVTRRQTGEHEQLPDAGGTSRRAEMRSDDWDSEMSYPRVSIVAEPMVEQALRIFNASVMAQAARGDKPLRFTEEALRLDDRESVAVVREFLGSRAVRLYFDALADNPKILKRFQLPSGIVHAIPDFFRIEDDGFTLLTSSLGKDPDSVDLMAIAFLVEEIRRRMLEDILGAATDGTQLDGEARAWIEDIFLTPVLEEILFHYFLPVRIRHVHQDSGGDPVRRALHEANRIFGKVHPVPFGVDPGAHLQAGLRFAGSHSDIARQTSILVAAGSHAARNYLFRGLTDEAYASTFMMQGVERFFWFVSDFIHHAAVSGMVIDFARRDGRVVLTRHAPQMPVSSSKRQEMRASPDGGDADMPAGLIVRGDAAALIEALEAQALPPAGLRETIDRPIVAGRLKAILEPHRDALGAEIAGSVDKAIDDLSRFQLVEFQSVRLPLHDWAADKWLLLFNTAEPLLTEQTDPDSLRLRTFLRERFGENAIGYARDLLDNLSGDAMLEFLLYGTLSRYLGHRKTRAVMEKLFSETNYRYARDLGLRGKTGPGYLEGTLSSLISQWKYQRVEGYSLYPKAPSLSVKDLGPEWPQRVFEEAQSHGVVAVLGMAGTGKSSQLAADLKLSSVDLRNGRDIDLRRFFEENRGKTIILDEFHQLDEHLTKAIADVMAEGTNVILVGLPPSEHWGPFAYIRDKQGNPPMVFRLPGKSREEIKAMAVAELTRYREDVDVDKLYGDQDWDKLYELVGGNLRQAWTVLGIAHGLGKPISDIHPEELFHLGFEQVEKMRFFGRFSPHVFVSFYHQLKIVLSAFPDAYSLMSEIAKKPLDAAALGIDFTREDQERVHRLLDYGILRYSADGLRIEMSGSLFRELLNQVGAQWYFTPSLRAPAGWEPDAPSVPSSALWEEWVRALGPMTRFIAGEIRHWRDGIEGAAETMLEQLKKIAPVSQTLTAEALLDLLRRFPVAFTVKGIQNFFDLYESSADISQRLVELERQGAVTKKLLKDRVWYQIAGHPRPEMRDDEGEEWAVAEKTYRAAVRQIFTSRNLPVDLSLGSELIKSLTPEEIRGLGLDGFIAFDPKVEAALSEAEKNVARDGMIRQALFRAGPDASLLETVSGYFFDAVVHHRDDSAEVSTEADVRRYTGMLIDMTAASFGLWGAGALAVSWLHLTFVGWLISGFFGFMTLVAFVRMVPKTLKAIKMIGKHVVHGRFRILRRVPRLPLLVAAGAFAAASVLWLALPLVALEFKTVLAKAVLSGVIAALTRFYVEKILGQKEPEEAVSAFDLPGTPFWVSSRAIRQTPAMPFARTLARHLDLGGGEPDDEAYHESYKALFDFLRNRGRGYAEAHLQVCALALPGFAQKGELNGLLSGLVRAAGERLGQDAADRFLRALMSDPWSLSHQAAELSERVREAEKYHARKIEEAKGKTKLRAVGYLWAEFADADAVEEMGLILDANGGMTAQRLLTLEDNVEKVLQALAGSGFSGIQMNSWHALDAIISRELFWKLMSDHVTVDVVSLKFAALLAFTKDPDGTLKLTSSYLRDGEARKRAFGVMRSYLNARPFDIPEPWRQRAEESFEAIRDWPAAKESPGVVKWLLSIPPAFLRDRGRLKGILKILSAHFAGEDVAALNNVMELLYLCCLEPQTALADKRDRPLPFVSQLPKSLLAGVIAVRAQPSIVLVRHELIEQDGWKDVVTESFLDKPAFVNWLHRVANGKDDTARSEQRTAGSGREEALEHWRYFTGAFSAADLNDEAYKKDLELFKTLPAWFEQLVPAEQEELLEALSRRFSVIALDNSGKVGSNVGPVGDKWSDYLSRGVLDVMASGKVPVSVWQKVYPLWQLPARRRHEWLRGTALAVHLAMAFKVLEGLAPADSGVKDVLQSVRESLSVADVKDLRGAYDELTMIFGNAWWPFLEKAGSENWIAETFELWKKEMSPQFPAEAPASIDSTMPIYYSIGEAEDGSGDFRIAWANLQALRHRYPGNPIYLITTRRILARWRDSIGPQVDWKQDAQTVQGVRILVYDVKDTGELRSSRSGGRAYKITGKASELELAEDYMRGSDRYLLIRHLSVAWAPENPSPERTILLSDFDEVGFGNFVEDFENDYLPAGFIPGSLGILNGVSYRGRGLQQGDAKRALFLSKLGVLPGPETYGIEKDLWAMAYLHTSLALQNYLSRLLKISRSRGQPIVLFDRSAGRGGTYWDRFEQSYHQSYEPYELEGVRVLKSARDFSALVKAREAGEPGVWVVDLQSTHTTLPEPLFQKLMMSADIPPRLRGAAAISYLFLRGKPFEIETELTFLEDIQKSLDERKKRLLASRFSGDETEILEQIRGQRSWDMSRGLTTYTDHMLSGNSFPRHPLKTRIEILNILIEAAREIDQADERSVRYQVARNAKLARLFGRYPEEFEALRESLVGQDPFYRFMVVSEGSSVYSHDAGPFIPYRIRTDPGRFDRALAKIAELQSGGPTQTLQRPRQEMRSGEAHPQTKEELRQAARLSLVRRQLMDLASSSKTPMTITHIERLMGDVQSGKIKLANEDLEVVAVNDQGVEELIGPVNRAFTKMIFYDDGTYEKEPDDNVVTRNGGKRLSTHSSYALIYLPRSKQLVYMQKADKNPAERKLKLYGGGVVSRGPREKWDMTKAYDRTVRRELPEELEIHPKLLKGADFHVIGKHGGFGTHTLAWRALRMTVYFVKAGKKLEKRILRKQEELRRVRDSLRSTADPEETRYWRFRKSRQKKEHGAGEAWEIVTIPLKDALNPETLQAKYPAYPISATLKDVLSNPAIRRAARAAARQEMRADQAESFTFSLSMDGAGETPWRSGAGHGRTVELQAIPLDLQEDTSRQDLMTLLLGLGLIDFMGVEQPRLLRINRSWGKAQYALIGRMRGQSDLFLDLSEDGISPWDYQQNKLWEYRPGKGWQEARNPLGSVTYHRPELAMIPRFLKTNGKMRFTLTPGERAEIRSGESADAGTDIGAAEAFMRDLRALPARMQVSVASVLQNEKQRKGKGPKLDEPQIRKALTEAGFVKMNEDLYVKLPVPKPIVTALLQHPSPEAIQAMLGAMREFLAANDITEESWEAARQERKGALEEQYLLAAKGDFGKWLIHQFRGELKAWLLSSGDDFLAEAADVREVLMVWGRFLESGERNEEGRPVPRPEIRSGDSSTANPAAREIRSFELQLTARYYERQPGRQFQHVIREDGEVVRKEAWERKSLDDQALRGYELAIAMAVVNDPAKRAIWEQCLQIRHLAQQELHAEARDLPRLRQDGKAVSFGSEVVLTDRGDIYLKDELLGIKNEDRVSSQLHRLAAVTIPGHWWLEYYPGLRAFFEEFQKKRAYMRAMNAETTRQLPGYEEGGGGRLSWRFENPQSAGESASLTIDPEIGFMSFSGAPRAVQMMKDLFPQISANDPVAWAVISAAQAKEQAVSEATGLTADQFPVLLKGDRIDPFELTVYPGVWLRIAANRMTLEKRMSRSEVGYQEADMTVTVSLLDQVTSQMEKAARYDPRLLPFWQAVSERTRKALELGYRSAADLPRIDNEVLNISLRDVGDFMIRKNGIATLNGTYVRLGEFDAPLRAQLAHELTVFGAAGRTRTPLDYYDDVMTRFRDFHFPAEWIQRMNADKPGEETILYENMDFDQMWRQVIPREERQMANRQALQFLDPRLYVPEDDEKPYFERYEGASLSELDEAVGRYAKGVSGGEALEDGQPYPYLRGLMRDFTDRHGAMAHVFSMTIVHCETLRSSAARPETGADVQERFDRARHWKAVLHVVSKRWRRRSGEAVVPGAGVSAAEADAAFQVFTSAQDGRTAWRAAVQLEPILQAMLDKEPAGKWDAKIKQWIPEIVQRMIRYNGEYSVLYSFDKYLFRNRIMPRLIAMDPVAFSDPGLLDALVDLADRWPGRREDGPDIGWYVIELIDEALRTTGRSVPASFYAKFKGRAEEIRSRTEYLGHTDRHEYEGLSTDEAQRQAEHFRTAMDRFFAKIEQTDFDPIPAKTPVAREEKRKAVPSLNLRHFIAESRNVPAAVFVPYEEIRERQGAMYEGLLSLATQTAGGQLQVIVYGGGERDLELKEQLTGMKIEVTDRDLAGAYALYGKKLDGHCVNVAMNAARLKKQAAEFRPEGLKHLLAAGTDEIWGAYLLAMGSEQGMDGKDGFYRVTGDLLRAELRSYQASLVVMSAA